VAAGPVSPSPVMEFSNARRRTQGENESHRQKRPPSPVLMSAQVAVADSAQTLPETPENLTDKGRKVAEKWDPAGP